MCPITTLCKAAKLPPRSEDVCSGETFIGRPECGMGLNSEKKEGKASLQDAEVIRYFKEVDALPQEDKSALLRVIAGFIRDVKTEQAYAS